ncbi:MAG: DNA cytosine methyltransferase, partial [Nanoarchaeota archaeon]|nr:DNA cytosine methyltransferase [Nanoarchaeota archaeon]
KWTTQEGVFASEFHIDSDRIEEENEFEIVGDLPTITEKFNKNAKNSMFNNSGTMIDRKVYTAKLHASYEGKRTLLKDIMIPEKDVPESFFINGDIEKWKYLKGAKNEERYNKKRDFKYFYTEGPMIFPDSLDKPSRTIVTGEGGSSASRFKHVVKCESGRLRRLTPLELERLNMFPDNHTEGISDIKRAFTMGNALVIGVIEKIGKGIIRKIN